MSLSRAPRTTIRDISRLSGVSIGTVDRVIHNRGRVSPATVERVKKVIEETGYAPDVFASRLSRKTKTVFAVVMPHGHQESGYWELCLQGIRRAEQTLKAYDVSVVYRLFDRYSPGDLERVLSELREEPCSGYLIAPVIPGPVAEAFENGDLDGPVSFIDTLIPGFPSLSCTGQDSFQSGMVAGRLMSLLVPPGKPVIAVEFGGSDVHLKQRIDGFRNFFSYRGLPVPARIRHWNTDDIAPVKKLLAPHLRRLSGGGGIFVPNSTTHLFAAAAQGAGFGGDAAARGVKASPGGAGIHIIGYDAVPENAKALKEGYIDFLISQRPQIQGSEALMKLYTSVVLRRPVSPRTIMPIDIITPENLEQSLSGEPVRAGAETGI